MTDDVSYTWRSSLTDDEMVDLVESHGGRAVSGWWDQVSPHSLGWIAGRSGDGVLIGFVNVAWDGGDHAFLIDTKTRGTHQHRGIGIELVRHAATHAKAAGCQWLHVDFEPELASFYVDACGFRRTDAGLIYLPTRTDTRIGHGHDIGSSAVGLIRHPPTFALTASARFR